MALRYERLTSKSINALGIGKQLQEHGIVVKRTKYGDLNWSINTMVDGLRIHRVLGLARDGVTREAAEATLEALRTRAREERLSLPQGRKTCKTLAVAADEYLRRLEAEDGKDLVCKRRHFRLHLKPLLGHLPINKITEERLSKYRRTRKEQGVKDSTINRELSSLSHFFTKATSKKWKWMSVDDVPVIYKTPEPKMPFPILSSDELDKLFKAAEELGGTHLLFLEMMAGSTMRPDEVMKSRFEHVSDHRYILMIPEAKAGAREQPVSEHLAKLLRARRAKLGQAHGWIFPSPHFGPSRHRVAYAPFFKCIVERAGLDPHKFTPYSVRRTSITEVASSGIDINGLMVISGHKTVVSVLRYIHTRDAEINRALKKLDRGASR